MTSTAHHLQPKMKATTAAAVGTNGRRWQHPTHPPQSCQFSGSQRASRRHKMPIQRRAPSHPPAISAEIMQMMQNVQQLCIIRIILNSCRHIKMSSLPHGQKRGHGVGYVFTDEAVAI